MTVPAQPFVTYRMADGDLILGEYAFMTDVDAFEEADFDEPTQVIKETWALVDSKILTFGPEPIDDEDDE